VNPAAYGLPDVGTYGNAGVGSVRGPAFWQWDQSVSRQFQVNAKQQIEIRVEAFNVTDSLRLANPIMSLSDARFGRIVSSTGGPRVMQVALRYIF
jgi:hypothetical protein